MCVITFGALGANRRRPCDTWSARLPSTSPSGGIAVSTSGTIERSRATLPWLFVLYAAATLLHFAHNAEYLGQYPNLPSSWSRAEVYAAWCLVTALGLLAYGLYGLGLRNLGLTLLAVYAALGFGGLLHYARASMAHHSAMMNVTIWAEAAAGTLLLANVVVIGGSTLGLLPPKHRWRDP